MAVIPLPFWALPRGGSLGARSPMEERTGRVAVPKHQLSSHEDASCSRAGSFCCPLPRGWGGFAARTAWTPTAATSLAQVLSAFICLKSICILKVPISLHYRETGVQNEELSCRCLQLLS